MNVWLTDVYMALQRLGKPSPLTDIYHEVRVIRANRGESPRKYADEAVRRTLQQFSSDTSSYAGREDVFTSAYGVGEGIWALREGAELSQPFSWIAAHNFVVGHQYRRRESIHGIFGGGQQSGISPSRNSPFIFLFTSDTGRHYGYEDGWEENTFNFFGEGQAGDMVFTKGNKAVRDHVNNGKILLLFRNLGKGKPVEFLGEFVCIAYREVRAEDRNKQERNAFIFQLQRTEEAAEHVEIQTAALELPIEELRKRAYEAAVPQPKTMIRTVYARERKSNVKAYALKRANGFCECCGAAAPFLDSKGIPYLEVHHIHKLADNGLDNPSNVAAITPNCHRKIHHGKEGQEIDMRLAELIAKKESRPLGH